MAGIDAGALIDAIEAVLVVLRAYRVNNGNVNHALQMTIWELVGLMNLIRQHWLMNDD